MSSNKTMVFTLGIFWVSRIVIDLQRRVDVGPGEPDDVIAAVVDLRCDVADRNVLRTQVVVQKHFPANLR
jgi:hypothetical protein